MWRRALWGALAALAVWLCGVWPPPLWWRSHWPRETAMMRWHPVAHAGAPYQPTPLAAMAPALRDMVILGEDARFRSHWGVDVVELRDALGLRPGIGVGAGLRTVWQHRRSLRGASTITQQLAKNLYLSPTRNPLRKAKEVATAVRFEAALSKERILELYLNVAEWGIDIWGAEAASHAYFNRPASRLSVGEAAALAATLPHPRSSNPVFQPARMEWRQRLILARYYGADVVIPAVDELGLDSLVVPVLPVVPPVLDSLNVHIPTGVDSGPARER